MLQPTDIVGGTFWLLSAGMAAAAVFFFGGTFWVAGKWKTPLAVIGSVSLVSAVVYFRVTETWIDAGTAPIIYRYVDWLITVPLQIVVFYLIVAAVTQVSVALFWRLLAASSLMLLAAFLGDAEYMNTTLAFLIWAAGWVYILGELYVGRASEVYSKDANETTRIAYFWMRLIVTTGFAVPLLGYFVDNFTGGVHLGGLNVVYNLIDILNKIVFGLILFRAAMKDSQVA